MDTGISASPCKRPSISRLVIITVVPALSARHLLRTGPSGTRPQISLATTMVAAPATEIADKARNDAGLAPTPSAVLFSAGETAKVAVALSVG